MSTYCIGDIHGRYDLFLMMLDKIKFDPHKDHIYLLGDVIDGSDGSIEVLEHIMNNQESITLLRGNHEENILRLKSRYDNLVLDRDLNRALKKMIKEYSSLFDEIEDVFLKRMVSKNKDYILSAPKIKKWLKTGDVKKRAKIFEAMFEFATDINFETSKYQKISLIFALMSKSRTRKFVLELLELTPDKYNNIILFLENASKSLTLNISGKHIVLCHSVSNATQKLIPDYIYFQHANTQGIYYVFGHIPIPKIHKKYGSLTFDDINYENRFDFDFRTALSYIDVNGNKYYNLDTASNPICALCLENMVKYYVGIPKMIDNVASWEVPNDQKPLDVHYQYIEKASFYTEDKRRIVFSKRGRNKAVLVTFNDNCYEYLIGIYKPKKQILYTRIDWFDYQYAFVIDDWYNGQSEEEIIAKVNEDFMERLKSPIMQTRNNILHGISIDNSNHSDD